MRKGNRSRGATLVCGTYGLMSLLLLGFLVSLLVQSDRPWPIFNGWAVAGFEIVGSGLCIARGLSSRSSRTVPVAMGLGLMMWAVGDLVTAAESRNGVPPPTPSWADAFYVAFFPLTYVAVVLFLRGEIRRFTTPNWLDGAVAGAGVAAACAAFAFHDVLNSTGGGLLQTATNMAYPVADLLLLGLVGGGMTVMSDRNRVGWLLMAAGIAVNVVGDTANLFISSLGRTGFVLDAVAWPTSILLMSMSVWVPPTPTNIFAPQRPGSFLVPGLSASCALLVLFVGNLRPISGIAVGLATLTLALVGLRLANSVRSMRALSQQRRDQSITDELTGLKNRRYLGGVLDSFFADYGTGPARRSLAFLFVDLNHFKEINDTFGHAAGDQLLAQLGPRLQACLREDDLLVRLGGDEFVVLLVDADARYGSEVAQRLTETLTDPIPIGVLQANVTASIGIAVAPADATDGTSLQWCADMAMYRAKLGGVPFATYHQDTDRVGNRVQLLTELRTAIAEHELVLYYQPQLDLRTGQILSVEGLIRWAHPTLGILSPNEFLPFAEDAGLMGPITHHVLTEALTQCALWHREGQPVTVSINVSVSVFLGTGFAQLVHTLLADHHLPSSALVIEITETSVMSDFGRAQCIIQQLADFGVTVSIDDFGAGFTSLAHLSNLAVKELKLDRTFIAKMTGEGNARDLELVRATIGLGHALGLRIVAEGIEDAQTLQLLTDLDCDLGQGYLISIPKPARHLHLQPTPTTTHISERSPTNRAAAALAWRADISFSTAGEPNQ